LLKLDGYPTCHLAVVVDDHLVGVTHVIRAEEWITSTPIHVLLYSVFGWQTPEVVHVPILRNPDATKLSKRKSDTSVDSRGRQGVQAEAVLNYRTTQGRSIALGGAFFSLGEMIAAFDVDTIDTEEPALDLEQM